MDDVGALEAENAGQPDCRNRDVQEIRRDAHPIETHRKIQRNFVVANVSVGQTPGQIAALAVDHGNDVIAPLLQASANGHEPLVAVPRPDDLNDAHRVTGCRRGFHRSANRAFQAYQKPGPADAPDALDRADHGPEAERHHRGPPQHRTRAVTSFRPLGMRGEEVFDLRRGDGDGKAFEHPTTPVLAETERQLAIAQQTNDSVGQCSRIVRRNDDPRLFVQHGVREARDIGHDHRPRHQQRLDRSSKIVDQRRLHGDVERRKNIRNVLPVAGEDDRVIDADALREHLHLPLICDACGSPPASDEREPGVGHGRENVGNRVQEDIVSLEIAPGQTRTEHGRRCGRRIEVRHHADQRRPISDAELAPHARSVGSGRIEQRLIGRVENRRASFVGNAVPREQLARIRA